MLLEPFAAISAQLDPLNLSNSFDFGDRLRTIEKEKHLFLGSLLAYPLLNWIPYRRSLNLRQSVVLGGFTGKCIRWIKSIKLLFNQLKSHQFRKSDYTLDTVHWWSNNCCSAPAWCYQPGATRSTGSNKLTRSTWKPTVCFFFSSLSTDRWIHTNLLETGERVLSIVFLFSESDRVASAD